MNYLKYSLKPGILCIALFLALGSGAWAQSESHPLLFSMSIHTERSEYWLGEPVEIVARVVNWHTPLAEVSGNFTLKGDNTQLQIVKDGEIGGFYKGHYTSKILLPRSIPLSYGEAIEFQIMVAGDKETLSGLAMETPGQYEFVLKQKMFFRDGARHPDQLETAQLATRSLPIRVVEPPAEAAGALKLLRSRPGVLVDLGRRVCSLSSRAVMEQVVRDYPDSRYAPHCLHALGALSLFLSQSVAGEKQRAIDYFEKVLSQHPDYILLQEVRMDLATLCQNNGQFNRAMALTRQVVSDSEDNLTRFSDRTLIQRLMGPVPNPFESTNSNCWYLFEPTRLTNAYRMMRSQGGP